MKEEEFKETVLTGSPEFLIGNGTYCARSRSNYFRVKDEQEFRRFCMKWGLLVIRPYRPVLSFVEKDEDGYSPCDHEITDNFPRFGFKHNDTLPTGYADQEGEFVEKDFAKELAAQLAEGEIAVCIENGNDQMRYLNAFGMAVNSKGETVHLSLDEVYDRAEAKFGTRPAAAER